MVNLQSAIHRTITMSQATHTGSTAKSHPPGIRWQSLTLSMASLWIVVILELIFNFSVATPYIISMWIIIVGLAKIGEWKGNSESFFNLQFDEELYCLMANSFYDF